MPETLAAAAITATYASAAGPAVFAISYGTILQATVVVGATAAARASQRRAERRAFNASLQDRTSPIRQSDAARTIVYGRTRVSGPIVYHKTHGDRRESVSHVIPLAGHEITAVDDVWFNDRSIAPWSGGAVGSGSPYYVSRPISLPHRWTGGGAGSTMALPLDGGTFVALDTLSYTLTTTIESGTGDAYVLTQDSREVQLVGGTDFTMAGSTITLTTAAAQGKPITATYRVDKGDAYAAVYAFLGAAAGERDTNLEIWSTNPATGIPEWSSTAIGCNVARLHVLTTWQESLYATGFPGVSAIIRGKRVYDPRLDSTNGGSGSHRADTASTWTYGAHGDNPALCAVDYLRDALGFGCASSEIDWPSVIAAANVCDELVPIDAGSGTQKRYTCAGVLSTETDRKTNLEAILDSMVGIAVYSGGRWTIRAGAYVTPTLDLDEGDLAGGDITVQARANRRDLFNAVRGRYREPNQLYQVTDFPPYASSTYATEDAGEVIYREVDLQMVDDARRAQRIAKLILFRSRQALTFQATFKLSAYALQPGDTCRVTIARYGWANKVFRVLRREFGSLSTVRLTLQEDASSIYSWSFSEAVVPDPAPNTALPDPRFVRIPGGIAFRADASTYYVRTDGVLVPYVEISWTVPAEDDVAIEVYWKRTQDLEYRRERAPIGASYVRLEGVSGGEVLNVYIEAVNGIGARSARFWQPSYRVSADVQSGRQSIAENQIRNASLDTNFAVLPAETFNLNAGDVADFRKHPSVTHNVPGTPSSAYLSVRSALTGNARLAYYRWPAVAARPGETFALYGSLVGWGTDAVMGVQWFDANGTQIGETQYGNIVNGGAWDGPRWNEPANYGLSALISPAPAGTRTARPGVYASRNWAATPSNERCVSVHRPFFGAVPTGTTQLPPWNAGGTNTVNTDTIAPDAVALVLSQTFGSSRTVRADGQPDTTGLPSVVLPASLDVDDGATLRVSVSLSIATTGSSAAGSFQDIGMQFGVRDSLDGVYYPGAILFDQHLSAARDMSGVTLRGGGTWSMTFSHRRGVERQFSVGVGFFVPVGGVDNSRWTTVADLGSNMAVEVLKR